MFSNNTQPPRFRSGRLMSLCALPLKDESYFLVILTLTCGENSYLHLFAECFALKSAKRTMQKNNINLFWYCSECCSFSFFPNRKRRIQQKNINSVLIFFCKTFILFWITSWISAFWHSNGKNKRNPPKKKKTQNKYAACFFLFWFGNISKLFDIFPKVIWHISE